MVSSGAAPEAALVEVLREVDLVHFQRPLCSELQLLRLEHFDHVRDDELQQMAGIPLPAVRRLRQAIAARKQKEAQGLLVNNENRRPTSDAVIPKEQIKLMEKLGEGTFAVVKRALWTNNQGQRIDVAVKILRDASPQVMEDLQQEAGNLLKLQHQNLIRLYGVVEQPAMMVFELCEGGCLLDRLRDTSKPALPATALLDYCQQIATGMTYLEAKHCVHRDLATRNILLSADEKMVKIADFGLMRSLEENQRLYVMSAQKKVPFAWCPPESLRHRQFSHASDVWAFGVCMWEIFTYGEEPWIGLRGIDVLKKVEEGDRLAKPRRCSQQIFDIISLCWKLNPDQRPKFSLLRGFLKEAHLNTAETREVHRPTQDATLELAVSDKVIVIEDTGLIWYGQNVRTRQFGSFLRSAVFVGSNRTVTPIRGGGGGGGGSGGRPTVVPVVAGLSGGNPKISLPMPGSFIHAGHGDVRGGSSWGQPERIDDIYLKNPIVSKNPPPASASLPSTSLQPTLAPSNPSTSPAKSKPQLPSKPPAINTSAPKRKNDDPFDAWNADDSLSHPQPGVSYDPVAMEEVLAAARIPPRTPLGPQNTFVPKPILAPQPTPIPLPSLRPTPPPVALVPPTKPVSRPQTQQPPPPLPETQRPPLNIQSVPRPVSSLRQSPELSQNGNSRSNGSTPPQIDVSKYAHVSNLSQPVKLPTQQNFPAQPLQPVQAIPPMQPIQPIQPIQQRPQPSSHPQLGSGISLTPLSTTQPPASATTNRMITGGVALHGLSSNVTPTLRPIPAAAPLPSTSASSIPPPMQPTRVQLPSATQQSLVNELSKRLGSNASPSNSASLNNDVRLRPSFQPQETPCLVHSQMGTLQPSRPVSQIPPTLEELFPETAPASSRFSMPPAVSQPLVSQPTRVQIQPVTSAQANVPHSGGPDPFEVPSSILNVTQRERYSQVMEKKASVSSIQSNASAVSTSASISHVSSSASLAPPQQPPSLPPPLVPTPTTSVLQAQPAATVAPAPRPASTVASFPTAATTSAASLLPEPSQLFFGTSSTSSTASSTPRTTAPTTATTATPRAGSAAPSVAALPSYNSLFPETTATIRPTTTVQPSVAITQPLQPARVNPQPQPSMLLFNANSPTARPSYPSLSNNFSSFTPSFSNGPLGYQTGAINWGGNSNPSSYGGGGYSSSIPQLSSYNAYGGYGIGSGYDAGGYNLTNIGGSYGGLGSMGSASSGIGSYSSMGSTNLNGSSSTAAASRPPPIGFNVALSDDILREFDPTFSTRSAPATSTAASTSQPAPVPNSQPTSTQEALINQLHRECSEYADRGRCTHVLENCNWDVGLATREMKIERLIDLNFASGRGQAESALQRANWDLNEAANLIFGM